jgi:hypothetical protein
MSQSWLINYPENISFSFLFIVKNHCWVPLFILLNESSVYIFGLILYTLLRNIQEGIIMDRMFAISTELGFERVIEKIDQMAIKQQSSRSAVTRELLYNILDIEPLPKSGKINRSEQLIRQKKWKVR